MRVQLVINGTDFGGTESALAQIARRLAARGHQVHVLSLKALGRIGRRLREEGVAVDSLGMGETVGPWALAAATARLAVRLRRRRPDVVHSFLPRANVVSRLANRVAATGCPHFSSERSTDFRRSPAVARLDRWTRRWTDRILAVSPAVEEVLVRRDRVPREKIVVLDNGIDVEAVDTAARTKVRERLGLGREDLVLCAAGRLIPDKGFAYLVRALARMSRRDVPTHLLLVGEGPEEDAVRREVAAHGLGRRVHLLGFRRDVVGIFKDADVYVLSSLEEGVPVVVLEAMACGLPVVATRVGGVPGLVVDGETGILVPPAEVWDGRPVPGSGGADAERGVAALADALDRLAADPELRRRLGRGGRRRAASDFDLARVTARLEALYAAALGSAATA